MVAAGRRAVFDLLLIVICYQSRMVPDTTALMVCHQCNGNELPPSKHLKRRSEGTFPCVGLLFLLFCLCLMFFTPSNQMLNHQMHLLVRYMLYIYGGVGHSLGAGQSIRPAGHSFQVEILAPRLLVLYCCVFALVQNLE